MTRIHDNSSQDPERWETETDDEEDVGMDQVEELVLSTFWSTDETFSKEEETEVGENRCSDLDGFGDNDGVQVN